MDHDVGVSIYYIAIASAMIFLTLVLTPRVSRRANIVLPVAVIWYPWTWPAQGTRT
jgi:hypothetical protein